MDMHEGLKTLLKQGAPKDFDKDSIMLFQGEIPRSMYFIREGIVKAYSISAAGEEQIVTFHTKGELFPTPWLFQKTTATLFFYEATTPVKAILIPRQRILDAAASDQKIAETLMHYYAHAYIGMMLQISALSQPRAREKITYALHFLAKRYGQQKSDGIYMLPFPLTHQNFANLVGLTRETTAMEMVKLKKEGVLTYKAQYYTINMTKLMQILGEDSFETVEL